MWRSPRVASRYGNRLSEGQSLLLSRHAIRGPSFAARRANTPAMNFSSTRHGQNANTGSFSSSPTALVLGVVLAAGFASALYSIDAIRLDTTRAYNPDAAWSEETMVKTKSKAGPRTLHEGLTSSAKPSPESSISHGTEDRSYDMLSPEQVTKHLHKNETSTVVNKSGVLCYYTNQVACNDPLEDDHDELVVTASSPADSVKWAFWAIYDGHSGWATAAKLRQSLIPYVYNDLAELYKASSSSSGAVTSPRSFQSNSDVIKTIQSTFLALDHEIVWSHLDTVNKADSKALATKLLAPALSGSCALLAFYDATSQLLRVACTGDCRAVLGRRVDSKTWSATPLSSDQTGANPEEAARIRAEHPPEENGCVAHGRVLGYEPSRVFGDATLKWPKKLAQTIRQKFYGKSPSEKVLTPPYATAEPMVTATKIHPEKGDFVVMACDGLWEMLSNEEVVALVAEWIDKKDQLAAPKPGEPKSWWSTFFGGDVTDKTKIKVLPPVVPSVDADKFFREAPVRPRQWQIAATPGSSGRTRQFVVQDANVATHLIRNGLGGGDHDLISSLLMLEGKNARRFRDDLTVTVIFFGSEADNKKE